MRIMQGTYCGISARVYGLEMPVHGGGGQTSQEDIHFIALLVYGGAHSYIRSPRMQKLGAVTSFGRKDTLQTRFR